MTYPSGSWRMQAKIYGSSIPESSDERCACLLVFWSTLPTRRMFSCVQYYLVVGSQMSRSFNLVHRVQFQIRFRVLAFANIS